MMSIQIIDNFLKSEISDSTFNEILLELKTFKFGQKILKNLLIQPPHRWLLFDNIRAKEKKKNMKNFPPYGLAVLASHLKDYNCRIVNLNDVIIDEIVLKDDDEFNYERTLHNKLDKS